MEDEAGDVFEINLEIFDEPMAAFLVARRVNERVEDASDLSEVDRGALDQGEDETGEEVDAAGISVKKGFQGLLELGMLVRRASILSDREAPIVSGGVLDGYLRLMSDTMIDKTKLIQPLLESGGYFFLSRTRRFGKSLLVFTLKAIYDGRKDLFAELWLEGRCDFAVHPVIRLDFSNINLRICL